MLTEIEYQLVNHYQHEMPMSPTPFADIAEQLDIDEAKVISVLKSLTERGIVSRVGPVFQHKKVGASTLVAMSIPENKLQTVADIVSSYAEVNHNHERDDDINLWFVVVAPTQQNIQQVLADIEKQTGFPVINLPMEQDFHIDLGFAL